MVKSKTSVAYRRTFRTIRDRYPKHVRGMLTILFQRLEKPRKFTEIMFPRKHPPEISICELLHQGGGNFKRFFGICARAVNTASLAEALPEIKQRLRRPALRSEEFRRQLNKLTVPELSGAGTLQGSVFDRLQKTGKSDEIHALLIKVVSQSAIENRMIQPSGKCPTPPPLSMGVGSEMCRTYWKAMERADRHLPAPRRKILNAVVQNLTPSDIKVRFRNLFLKVLPQRVKYRRAIVQFLMEWIFASKNSATPLRTVSKAIAHSKKPKGRDSRWLRRYRTRTVSNPECD